MAESLKRKNNRTNSEAAERIRPTLDLTRTAVKDIFVYRSRPWDAIVNLNKYIKDHGYELPYDEYDEIAENVWVHITAYLSPTAKIDAPSIICGGAKICHYSHVESSVVGAFATVGEMSTIKNSILFDKSKLCGHNEFYSSILGYESIIGAGSMVPDTRLDGLNVGFDMPEGYYVSGKAHLGSVICDGVKIGASCVINPGTVIDVGSTIHPLTSLSGYVYPYTTIC